MTVLAAAVEKLPVDEDALVDEAFSFSPPEERPLDERWITPPRKPFPFPEAKIEKRNGVPTFVIDGEAMPGWSRTAGASMYQGAPVERQLREEGMRLFMIDVRLTASKDRDLTLETAPEAAFAEFQERADQILAAVPDACLMIRFWMMNVATDFASSHPDELLAGEDGRTDWGRSYHSQHTVRPNMLNAWRRYCAEHLYRFIHRLGASEYAPRVGGFYIGAMNTGEWWFYKGKGDPGWDYSPSRKAAFQRWVRHKYGEAPGAIAAAWGVPPGPGLLELPGLKERRATPVRPASRHADYLQSLNLPVTGAALYFARVIKAATGGRSLAGMEIHQGFMTFRNNGTVYTRALLKSPDIDFFGGPAGYSRRRPGSSPLYRAALKSLERHGKLWWNEGDLRTPMAHGTRSGAAGEPPETVAEMRQVLHREFARGAVLGYPTYLMDFGSSWFYEPAFMESIGELLEVDRFVRSRGVKRKAQVALVTDQESQLYSNYYANPTRLMLNRMDQLGTAWDFFELSDFLEEGAADPYRLVVFLNIQALSDRERAAIERLKAGGRVVVWMHDPGVVDLSARGRDPGERLASLTGLKLRLGSAPGPVRLLPQAVEELGVNGDPGSLLGEPGPLVTTELYRQVSLSDVAEGLPIGNAPSRIDCIDPDAIPLGAEEGTGRIFFAMRRFPEWTSVYTAFCDMNPVILRALARAAGCHLYLESGDPFFASENFVAIHASTDGVKRLTLPVASGVSDVFSRSMVAKKARELSLTMKRGETRMLYLGEVEEALGELDAIHHQQQAERTAFRKAHPAPPMPAAYRRYFPSSPEKAGWLSVESFSPPALMVAGPFGSDEETVGKLDAAAQGLWEVPHWSPLPVKEDRPAFGLTADRFLQVVRPLKERSADGGPGAWYAVKPSAPWMNDYRLGMATGQSYLVAFHLEAKEDTPVRLFFAADGEARLWIDGIQVGRDSDGACEPLVTLSGKRRLVVFRLRGREKPTGFTVKIAAPDRGRPGDGKASAGDGPGALSLPTTTLFSWLPPRLLATDDHAKDEQATKK
ncbi:MAG TPA: hypothetical protein VNQ90_07210 [Chthoniobacteraceae bacterium]|nr:hypothetical protein [Chthoniobacteraceae bacterium]